MSRKTSFSTISAAELTDGNKNPPKALPPSENFVDLRMVITAGEPHCVLASCGLTIPRVICPNKGKFLRKAKGIIFRVPLMRKHRTESSRGWIRRGKYGAVAEKQDWNLGFANSSLMFWGKADI